MPAPEPDSIAGPVVALVLISGGLIYTFGYARAVMHRANKDYKTTKAAVPVLRKAFWSALGATFKSGLWIFLAIAVLLIWAYHDVRSRR